MLKRAAEKVVYENVNSACCFVYYQLKLPLGAEKLKKVDNCIL
ncbi:MAG TPA: cyclic lactone autoinducer peptide [Lachnospiraceae bacterium]|nr:cyclic lactone autoinducer peptide [uncultured Lachnoclostridium sp.]HAU87744.1 cyclic lactone autoinducer peptide [Lachnospiraceae bacterium]